MKRYLGLWLMVLLLVVANCFLWSDLFRLGGDVTSKSSNSANDLAVEEELSQSEASAEGSQPTRFVPILMYHYIRDYTNQDDQLGIGLSVSPSTFQNQLTLLKNSGYQSITLNQFASGSYPNKSVVITFDDGYEDHYTDAWPILKNAGMIGTFFVVKNFTGKSGYLTQDQIREMRVGGMEIGGHSTSHKNLMNLSYEAAAKDIAQSLVGTDNVFCYPSGKYSPTTLEVVRDLKIRATVTTNYGIATDKSSLVELPRIRVKNGTDLLTVIAEETAKAKLAASTSQNTSN